MSQDGLFVTFGTLAVTALWAALHVYRRLLVMAFSEDTASPMGTKGSEDGLEHREQAQDANHYAAVVVDLRKQLKTAAAELQRQRDALILARAEVTAKDISVQSLFSIIQETASKRETDVGRLEAMLAQRNSKFAQLEEDFVEKETASVEMKEMLEGSTRELVQLVDIWAGKEAEIVALTEKLRETAGVLFQCEEKLAGKEEEILRLGESLLVNRRFNEELKLKLAKKSTMVAHSVEQLLVEKSVTATMEKLLKEIGEHAACLEENLAEKEAAIAQIQQDMTKKDALVKSAKQRQCYSEERCASLRRILSQKDTELERLTALMKTQEDTSKDRATQYEYNLAKMMDKLSECNKQLEASRSGDGSIPKPFREDKFVSIFSESDQRKSSRQVQPTGWFSGPNSCQDKSEIPIVFNRNSQVPRKLMQSPYLAEYDPLQVYLE